MTVVVVTAAQLIDDPALVAHTTVEFEQFTGDVTCETVIPESAKPPTLPITVM